MKGVFYKVGNMNINHFFENKIIRCVVLIVCICCAAYYYIDSNTPTTKSDNSTIITHEEYVEEIVYKDEEIYCVRTVDASNPLAPQVEHHTYAKKTDERLSITDISSLSPEEIFIEIQTQLRKKYPEYYKKHWGDTDTYISTDYYHTYQNSFDLSKLDFCPNESNEIYVYNPWCWTTLDKDHICVKIRR